MKELATLLIKAETKSSSILKIVIDILIDGKTDTQLKPYAPKKKPTSTCSRSGTRYRAQYLKTGYEITQRVESFSFGRLRPDIKTHAMPI